MTISTTLIFSDIDVQELDITGYGVDNSKIIKVCPVFWLEKSLGVDVSVDAKKLRGEVT